MRGTGRTHRMLEAAKEAARQGRAVYIIASDDAHARQLRQRLGNDRNELGIKVETPERDFDWRTMSLRGMHQNCRVFVDHWTIESKFSAILRELHRFDSVTPNHVLNSD